jgi:hypothetical protein
LPWLPVTLTTLGVLAGVGGVVGWVGAAFTFAVCTSSEAMLMVPPEEVCTFGEVQPQSAFGNEPPIARSKMMKNPWSTAACQAATPTWSSLTDQYSWPSRYQRICSSETLRSMISVYVWYPVWQPAQAVMPLVRPVYSLHGPPGATPQCSVDEVSLCPLTSSMMSVSPIDGQVPPVRSPAPSVQKAGQ